MTPRMANVHVGPVIRLAIASWIAACGVFAARSADAQDCLANTSCEAVTVEVEDGCIDDRFPGTLGCTANDVRVARAINLRTPGGGEPKCTHPGADVTFLADFEVELSATARHDVGLYFAIDGDPNGDGALTGDCSISVAPEAGLQPGGVKPYVDLDSSCTGKNCPQPEDLCGDISTAASPMLIPVEITTKCIDTDGNGFLNLPNCTSWRQPGANEVCDDPTDAFPGSPSKCNCDLGFNVNILVPAATLDVAKVPTPDNVDEPGGPVTFAVSVTNDSLFASVTLESLVDDRFGDVTVIEGSTCTVPQEIANGATYNCSFTAFVEGNGDSQHVNEVEASGVDENDNEISGSGVAVVAINDLKPEITVEKTADPTEVSESGQLVTFSVTVTNLSLVEPVTLTSLVDSIYGDLNGKGTCATGVEIPAGGSIECSFTAFVGGPPGAEMDVVTAKAVDDEGNEATASDSATVTITDVPGMIKLEKTVSPDVLDEPGGTVEYSFTITNTSSTDHVTIESLDDDKLGAVACNLPVTLAPGEQHSCSVETEVSGNGGTPLTNVATATGVDDDDQPVNASDDATVNFRDVAPTAALSKSVANALVTFHVVVKNTSTAEPLVLASLIDDQYGDLDGKGSCSVPRTLQPDDGEEGGLDEYSCSFEVEVTADGETVDEVTGTVVDDEGNFVEPSDCAAVTLTDAAECSTQ